MSEVCMTLHGIAGYFESTLYADEMLSIAPHSHTEGYATATTHCYIQCMCELEILKYYEECIANSLSTVVGCSAGFRCIFHYALRLGCNPETTLLLAFGGIFLI